MERLKHLKVTEIVMGKDYAEVHKWLDELFPKYRGFLHWGEDIT